jgi:hypothetical protein
VNWLSEHTHDLGSSIDMFKFSIDFMPMLVIRLIHQGDSHVIVATNIAETSLTIPNVGFVFNLGKQEMVCSHLYRRCPLRAHPAQEFVFCNQESQFQLEFLNIPSLLGGWSQKEFDSELGCEHLVLRVNSHANALQRRGRTGRTCPGVCLHLYHPQIDPANLDASCFVQRPTAQPAAAPGAAVVALVGAAAADAEPNGGADHEPHVPHTAHLPPRPLATFLQRQDPSQLCLFEIRVPPRRQSKGDLMLAFDLPALRRLSISSVLLFLAKCQALIPATANARPIAHPLSNVFHLLLSCIDAPKMSSCHVECFDLVDLGALVPGLAAQALSITRESLLESDVLLSEFNHLSISPLGHLVLALPFQPRYAYSIALGNAIEPRVLAHAGAALGHADEYDRKEDADEAPILRSAFSPTLLSLMMALFSSDPSFLSERPGNLPSRIAVELSAQDPLLSDVLLHCVVFQLYLAELGARLSNHTPLSADDDAELNRFCESYGALGESNLAAAGARLVECASLIPLHLLCESARLQIRRLLFVLPILLARQPLRDEYPEEMPVELQSQHAFQPHLDAFLDSISLSTVQRTDLCRLVLLKSQFPSLLRLNVKRGVPYGVCILYLFPCISGFISTSISIQLRLIGFSFDFQ